MPVKRELVFKSLKLLLVGEGVQEDTKAILKSRLQDYIGQDISEFSLEIEVRHDLMCQRGVPG